MYYSNLGMDSFLGLDDLGAAKKGSVEDLQARLEKAQSLGQTKRIQMLEAQLARKAPALPFVTDTGVISPVVSAVQPLTAVAKPLAKKPLAKKPGAKKTGLDLAKAVETAKAMIPGLTTDQAVAMVQAEEESASGVNWKLWGPVIGVGVLALFAVGWGLARKSKGGGPINVLPEQK